MCLTCVSTTLSESWHMFAYSQLVCITGLIWGWQCLMCLCVRSEYVLDFFLAGLTRSDWVLCLCVRSEYVLNIFLAGLICVWQSSRICVLERLQAVHAWYFSCWVGLMLIVSCVYPFTECTCLTFSLLGWSDVDWVPCVCVFAASMCLTFSLLDWWGWLSSVHLRIHRMYVLDIFFAGLIWCWLCSMYLCVRSEYVLDIFLVGWSKADCVLFVCVFTDCMCLTFSLLCWSEADWVSCFGLFPDGMLDIFLAGLIWVWLSLVYWCVPRWYVLDIFLAGLIWVWQVLGCSQLVRAWHFPCWVDLRLTGCLQFVCTLNFLCWLV